MSLQESRISSKTFFNFFEKIIRSHPLVYFVMRSIVRFTNIYEQDFDGIKLLNLKEKVNIIDVGASDGIASKFFSRNLNIENVICFEPNKNYVDKLKKSKIKNIIIKPFAIGNTNGYKKVFFPRYKFFSKNLDLITYTYYDKKTLLTQLSLDFKFRKNIKIVQQKLFIKKVGKIKKKIDLIKIDCNGFELSVLKGLIHIIKKDRPALIVEYNHNIQQIQQLLKKYSYKVCYFSHQDNKFTFRKKKYSYSENTYYLQKNHLI